MTLLGPRSTSSYLFFLLIPSLLILFYFGWTTNTFLPVSLHPVHTTQKDVFSNVWNYTRDAKNLKLSDEQCEVAFPKLYHEIDRPAKLRRGKRITLKELDEIPIVRGYMRAMIYDNELYMIAAGDGVNTRHLATMSAIHRAILTSPHSLPNIEFILNADDIGPPQASWTYARPKKDTDAKNWLMPDFGYYSWPEPHIGAYNEVQGHAIAVDKAVPWEQKSPELIWRGAVLNRKVREDLLHESENQTWSAVRVLNWGTDDKGESHDRLTMWDHCRYKFVAHTEGVSYSARLQNLQNCRSVIVAHEMYWTQHHSHLMQSSGPERNFVQVKEDWTDLKSTMAGLLELDSRPNGRVELEAIAENNVRTFRERYITPAAEACYWRRLFFRWAEVSPEPEFHKEERGEDGMKVWRGVPIESYLLMTRMEWPLG